MLDTLEEFKKQHVENYKKAIIEIVNNNTEVLVNEDIMSLIRKPPLDSMDSIKSKFLDLAKKNKIILNTSKLDEMIDAYRNDIAKCCDKVKKIRVNALEDIVKNVSFNKANDVIKFNKKDFNEINKQIKKVLKEDLQNSINKKIINKIDCVFADDVDDSVKMKISDEVVKFVKGIYQKQLLESIDFKILVKDTTLANGTKEHGERYLFTLNNSRIFQQNDN